MNNRKNLNYIAILKYAYEKQKESEYNLFSSRDIARKFGSSAYMSIHRMLKRGYIKRILWSYYRLTEKGLRLITEIESVKTN